jgi:hypothetical protein
VNKRPYETDQHIKLKSSLSATEISKRLGPPAWGLGVELTTPHRKKKLITNNLHTPRTWTDSLDKRPKLRNMDIRFLGEGGGVMWTGLVWLRIGTGGELL